jgi:predicted Ser/Thr protein kinase
VVYSTKRNLVRVNDRDTIFHFRMNTVQKKPITSSKQVENVNNNLTVVELREIAKKRGLIGYTKLLKTELIELLQSKPIERHVIQERREKHVIQERQEQHVIQERQERHVIHPIERQKPSVAPRPVVLKVPVTKPKDNSPTLRDLMPHDYTPEKVTRTITKDYTPEFMGYKKEGVSDYIKLSQLGKPGKEGTVYLVSHPVTLKRYAMKTFRKKKSGRTLEKEAFYQYLASKQGISPKIIEYNPEEKYIVMEILNQTLLDVIKSQGTLTSDQQHQIINVYKRLDSIGIMLNDANPLNLMEKDGKIFAIDYGFAKFTDHKDFKDYPYPNAQLMPLGLLLWLKDRQSTRSWTVIRNAISPEVRNKMNVDEWA